MPVTGAGGVSALSLADLARRKALYGDAKPPPVSVPASEELEAIDDRIAHMPDADRKQFDALLADALSVRNNPDRAKQQHLDNTAASAGSAPFTVVDTTPPLTQTQVLRRATLAEVSDHLVKLGAGNQADNVRSLQKFPNVYQVKLSREDFMNMVFLANDEVRPIIPPDDRRLSAVAARALQAGPKVLSANWDLGKIQQRFAEKFAEEGATDLPAIVLRDAQGSETAHGAKFYIQDGCHRSLAYAMAILAGKATYQPVTAYVATSRTMD
jgi:hypothetical protein